MNPFIKKILCWGMGLLSTMQTLCVANITFTNPATKLFINPTNSKMYIGNASKVTGWSQRSVVKNFGNNASSSWLEAYANGSVVGQAGQGGVPAVDKPARMTLVDANSNALCTFDPSAGTALRTTSNLLLYTARTHSSSIWVLRSRADSTSRDVRTTSNALLVLSSAIRTTSSAVNLIYQNMAVPTTGSIDGTVFAKYITNHYVFHTGGWNARGWVRFNNGFTILPQTAVAMDTLTTVSGPIDLRDTGVLKLNNDLYLSHNVTLTAGGYIKGNAANYGQANTIFMGGDLTLASDTYAKVLHITGDWANNGQSGDLIIDGCGHTLNIGSQAQIFVDQNVTLTLRNMTIKTSPASALKPAIQLASLGSKLALDNVMFDLGADFNFKQGQLFIHDEVAVTGTSEFIYTSPKPSYITSGATWSFETGTTFSIAPATYTDQPFTAGTATSNNFIVLADQSAALSLNNCSLKTTFTGARFSKGMVLFDNKVAIDTQAGSEITGLGAGVGLMDVDTTVTSVAFSPDGRYLATAFTNLGTTFFEVWRFNGTSTLSYLNSLLSFGTDTVPAIAWSPDSRFLAVGGESAFVGLRILGFNGTGPFNQITSQSFGIIVNAISWSPDGRYLAVGGNNGTTPLIIYRFDGTTLTQVTTANPTGGAIQVNGVAWSPDGKYLSIAYRTTGGSGWYQLFLFNGLTLSSITYGGNSGNATSVAWSHDQRFIAFGRYNGVGGNCTIIGFNGTATVTYPVSIDLGTQVNAVAWSPNGRYLLVCSSNGGSGIYGLYKVNISGATELLGTPAFGTVATTVAWSPDSKYVLVGGTNGTTDLMVFPTTMTATAASTQGFSNGLLFGDKAKGSAYDADVRVLSSATVKVRGKIKDDSV